MLKSPTTDASLVAPNLWIGAKPPPGLYRWLNVIVLCAKEYQPPSYIYPSVTVVRVPIVDDPTREMTDLEISLVQTNVKTIVRHLQSGQRVLVTCKLGLNRSSLVAALAMIDAFDMDSDEAIKQIRKTRNPGALFNKEFVKLIHSSQLLF